MTALPPAHDPARESSSLSGLVRQLSARYVRGASPVDIFDALLPDLLAFTGSTLGCIGRLAMDEQGPHLHLYTLRDLPWHIPDGHPAIAAAGPGQFVLRDFNSLPGRVITTGRPVIADGSGTSQFGMPPIAQFLGVPLVHGGTLVGVLGLANRPSGYDQGLIDSLQPAIAVLSGIVGAIELERAQREALLAQNVALDSLRRSQASYQQIFEAAGVGIARIALDGRLLDVNQRLGDILQRSRADLLRLSFLDITHPEDLPLSESLILQAIKGEQERFSMEQRCLAPDGGTLWVQVTSVLVRSDQGEPQHFVSVVEDISERRRYQEAILSAKAAERASQAKTEFLSRMSHELRTPLNAMLGFAQLLRVDPRNPLSDPQKQKVRHIEQAGAHLLAMLTDVLDLSRIEAGSLPLSLEALRVADVAGEAIAMVSTQAEKEGLRLAQGEIDDDVFVRADRVRLRQILVNLLSNAIKYNRPGGQVRLEVQAGRPHVAIAVHDTGKGLTPEQQAHLFEPFNRLGAERTGVEGTGIGLVIVQRLARLMQGQVQVDSVPGQGSVFRLLLPWAVNPQLETETRQRSGFSDLAALPADGEGLTLLYAEDNVVNVELVRQVMRLRPQWTLEVALSGCEAIEMAMARPPDLLLLDMHLGDMNGMDVADALARHGHTQNLPKVALSADVMPEQLRAARERGFVDYLTKPLDVSRLLKLLDSLESAGQPS